MLNSEFGLDTAHLLGPLLSHVDVRNVASATADRMRAAVIAGGGTASYLLVAIDRTSKFALAELHEKATRRVADNFLRALAAAVP